MISIQFISSLLLAQPRSVIRDGADCGGGDGDGDGSKDGGG